MKIQMVIDLIFFISDPPHILSIKSVTFSFHDNSEIMVDIKLFEIKRSVILSASASIVTQIVLAVRQ